MDLSKSIFLNFKSNTFNWIWIKYRLIHFLDCPKRILGWILTWPRPRLSRVNSGHVERSHPESMSCRVGLCRCRAKSAQIDVELSQTGMMSSRIGSGQCRTKSARAFVESSWAHVEPCQSWPIPSRVNMDPCHVE